MLVVQIWIGQTCDTQVIIWLLVSTLNIWESSSRIGNHMEASVGTRVFNKDPVTHRMGPPSYKVVYKP